MAIVITTEVVLPIKHSNKYNATPCPYCGHPTGNHCHGTQGCKTYTEYLGSDKFWHFTECKCHLSAAEVHLNVAKQIQSKI